MILSERIVRSPNAAFVSFIVEQISIPSALQSFFELCSKFCPLSYQNFFGLFFLVIIFEKVLTVSFESFVSFPLHLRFCQTSLGELVNTLHQNYCPITPIFVFCQFINIC